MADNQDSRKRKVSEPEVKDSKPELEKVAKLLEKNVPKTGCSATPEQLRLEMPGKLLQSIDKRRSEANSVVDSESEAEDIIWMPDLESHSRVCTRGECPKCDLWKKSLFSSNSPKPKIRSQNSPKPEVEKWVKKLENSVPIAGSHATPEQLRLEMPGKPSSKVNSVVDSESESEDNWMSELESHSRVCTRGECPKCDQWKKSLFSSNSPKPKIRSQNSATEEKPTAKEWKNGGKDSKNSAAVEPMVHAVLEPK